MTVGQIVVMMHDSAEYQLISIQNKDYEVLYIGTVADLTHSSTSCNFLSFTVITMFTEKYTQFDDEDGLTLIV